MFLFAVQIKKNFSTRRKIHGRDLTHNTPKSMGDRRSMWHPKNVVLCFAVSSNKYLPALDDLFGVVQKSFKGAATRLC